MMKGNTDNIDDELRTVNRALRVLSTCNQVIIRAVDENKLICDICKTIAEIGGYRFVWVGFKENDASKSVRPMAHAGHENGYLDLINITWGDTDSEEPAGKAIRTGKRYISNNLLEDIALKPWCAEAKKRGYVSSIALPLKDKEQTFGTISIYSAESESFNEEEIRLLTELAGDLSYGIMAIRNSGLREQAEEALKKSEARLKLQIERMPIAHIVWSPEFQVMFWNPTAEKIFGFTYEEALGKHPYDLIVPKSAQNHVDTIWKRLLEGDSTAHSENENITKDGRTIVCHWTNTPLKEDDGTVVGVLSMIQDITERKRAEEVLRESEERYRNLFENAHDIIQSCTSEGNIILTNPAWQKTMGYTEEELPGLNLSMVIHPDSLPHCQQMLSRVFNGESANNVETIFVAKDGRKIIMEGNITGRYMNGKIVAIQGIFRDITERKRFESEKEEMQFQLIQSEKMAAVGQLASSVVHELNNPLMAVTGYSSMLEEQLKSPTINKDQCLEMLETLKEGSKKCEETVKNLLEFSRHAKHERRLISPNEALNSILSLLEHKAGMEKIKINKKLQEDIPQIYADSNEMQTVFMNLIVNAFDAMKGGGTLTVESKKIDCKHVEFLIIDTGEGIPKENLPKLFEPFFTTKPSGQGTGLGLPIVKKIIEEYGAEIGVESDVGKGTRVWMKYPIAPTMVEQK